MPDSRHPEYDKCQKLAERYLLTGSAPEGPLFDTYHPGSEEMLDQLLDHAFLDYIIESSMEEPINP